MFEYLKYLNGSSMKELEGEYDHLLKLGPDDADAEFAVQKIQYVQQEIIFRHAMGAL